MTTSASPYRTIELKKMPPVSRSLSYSQASHLINNCYNTFIKPPAPALDSPSYKAHQTFITQFQTVLEPHALDFRNEAPFPTLVPILAQACVKALKQLYQDAKSPNARDSIDAFARPLGQSPGSLFHHNITLTVATPNVGTLIQNHLFGKRELNRARHKVGETIGDITTWYQKVTAPQESELVLT